MVQFTHAGVGVQGGGGGASKSCKKIRPNIRRYRLDYVCVTLSENKNCRDQGRLTFVDASSPDSTQPPQRSDVIRK